MKPAPKILTASPTQTFAVARRRVDDSGASKYFEEELVVEEALEIRLDGRRYTATMRTPGHDLELARGLLFSEGVLADLDDIESMQLSTACREQSDELVNIVDVILHDSSAIPAHLWERSLIANSSCGLCGRAQIEAVIGHLPPLASTAPLDLKVLWSLSQTMREAQEIFGRTGGLHAAAIFDERGQLLVLREDIGRHNATDKAIGAGLEAGWLPCSPGRNLILLVSGRASFEIGQKALMARLPILAAVSAASSLAVELAQSGGQTLIGWLRGGSCTVYCGGERLSG